MPQWGMKMGLLWRSWMRNSKNSILIGLSGLLGGAGIVQAATLLSFDRPGLVVVYDDKGTYGYYTGESVKRSAFSAHEKYECTFMFMRVDGLHEVSLRTLDKPIKDWDSAPYGEGFAQVEGADWKIQFSDRPSGCASDFDKDEIVVPLPGQNDNMTEYARRGAHFKLTKKSKVIGIRWVGFNAMIHRRVQDKFVSTGQKLGVGTYAVALREAGAFSEIEYVDLDKDAKVNVWLQSSKLTDPYPKN